MYYIYNIPTNVALRRWWRAIYGALHIDLNFLVIFKEFVGISFEYLDPVIFHRFKDTVNAPLITLDTIQKFYFEP